VATASRPVIEERYEAYQKAKLGTRVDPGGHATLLRPLSPNASSPTALTASRPEIEVRLEAA
jgi:hypothetical protein